MARMPSGLRIEGATLAKGLGALGCLGKGARHEGCRTTGHHLELHPVSLAAAVSADVAP